MANVWIMNNSMFGNSERLSNEIAEKLKDKHQSKVINIRKMKPQQISKGKPEILLVGARIIAFRADRKMRNFLKKSLKTLIEEPIQKVAVFYTHGASWKPRFGKKMDKTLKKLNHIKEVHPDILSIRVLDDKKGILETGYEQKLNKFLKDVAGN